MSDGQYHWGIIVTDNHSTATKHHWHEDVKTQYGYAECYSAQCFGTTLVPSHIRTVLGLFKLQGYHPHNDCQSTITRICEQAFPKGSSFKSVEENRANGLNCRTWLVQVLTGMWSEGLIIGRSDSVRRVEQVILERTKALDMAYLQAFFRGEAYQAVVQVV
jgi:hypothetical protein